MKIIFRHNSFDENTFSLGITLTHSHRFGISMNTDPLLPSGARIVPALSSAELRETLRARHPVGILGGMGPAAGVDFVRLFLSACERCLREHGTPIVDQAFPEHWLAQIPVVDRSRALLDPNAPQPLQGMSLAIERLARLGARTVAVACNTAHAWQAALQREQPDVELLHIAKETAMHLRASGVTSAMLLATEGTYRMALYQQAFDACGILCVLPAARERGALMEGIYDGVKAGRLELARERFAAVGRVLHEQHGDLPMVMACTEIPLAMPFIDEAREWRLVDPAEVLALALARRAYGLR
ncbi:aspartate/glutamate racemase family protein [Paraburkholderia kururiensis]|uniref:aspartate/glutamate racemase family protein n=1 Tax=Paraburkholderia kururiensis TaxID=984307 RepID=UPI003B79E9BF